MVNNNEINKWKINIFSILNWYFTRFYFPESKIPSTPYTFKKKFYFINVRIRSKLYPKKKYLLQLVLLHPIRCWPIGRLKDNTSILNS